MVKIKHKNIHYFFALFARNKKSHAKAVKVSHAKHARMSLVAQRMKCAALMTGKRK